MTIADLAKTLSDTKRLGLTGDLAGKLRLAETDVTLARLQARVTEERGFVAIHLVGVWIEDCRDLVGNGEVYWWSIPMLGDDTGKIRWNPLCGLPSGAAPRSVGSKAWLGSVSLADPPLLAVAPPDDDIAACIVRVGFYEDDWAPAKLGPALGKGLEKLAEASLPAPDIDAFAKPIRDAIFGSLKANQDDYILEKDLKFLREEGFGFGAGGITTALTEYGRVYVLSRDVDRTETCGPYAMVRGQTQRVLFPSTLERAGKLTIFARGSVTVNPFGTIDDAKPYLDVAIDQQKAATLGAGFDVQADTDAEVCAWYTPPRA